MSKKSDKIKTKNLKLIEKFSLKVKEPSGLTSNNNYFFVVSDKTNKVYQLDRKGNIISELAYKGDDLEGITYDKFTNTLWLCEEKKREIVNINLSGDILKKYELDILAEDKNSGLEGICINTKTKNIFILNEQKPELLIEMNRKGEVLKETELDMAKDFSGISYDEKHDAFWIVSDKSEVLIQYFYDKNEYNLFDIDIKKAEGVIIENGYIYIVSDKKEKLYQYELNY